MSEIELEHIESVISSRKPEYVVIDSIQTIFSSQLDSAPGSVSQVRECAARLTRMAKTVGTTLIFVGHVTKDGSLAGPRILEHIVDTVLYFEGDQHSNFRLVRAFKNRFGAVNELGVFAMTDHGLRGVTNPSAIFLSEYKSDIPGSSVLVTQEGTRRFSLRFRRSSTPRTCLRRGGLPSAWTRSALPCFLRSCTATRAWAALIRTSSSTPWAA